MGAIIKMDSKIFFDKFIKKENYKNFKILLASKDIKNKGGYENVFSMGIFLPPVSILQSYVTKGMTKKFVKEYKKYLDTPKLQTIIAVLVKATVIEDENVILLTSSEESEYQYVDILCKVIEKDYKVPTYTYKKFKNTDHPGEPEDRQECMKLLKEIIGKENMKPAILTKKQLKKNLSKEDKKTIYKMCKDAKVKVKKEMSKEDMIKKYVKKTFKD